MRISRGFLLWVSLLHHAMSPHGTPSSMRPTDPLHIPPCTPMLPHAASMHAQVQIPGTPHSFALIYSIEDPDGKNEHSGIGVQVCGW